LQHCDSGAVSFIAMRPARHWGEKDGGDRNNQAGFEQELQKAGWVVKPVHSNLLFFLSVEACAEYGRAASTARPEFILD
jgi:hypothetical protein